MQTHICFQSWLDHLRCLIPVTGALYVGAGDTGDSPCTGWGLSDVIFLETDGTLQEQLALLSGDDGSVSGPYQDLPRLINWAVIDSLPALPVIRGAGSYLDDWEVAIVRIAFDDASPAVPGAALAEIDDFLVGSGYLRLAIREEEQTAGIGHALYLRHWPTANRALQEKVARLTREIEGHSRQRSADKAIIEALTEAGEEQAREVSKLRDQAASLVEARDEQAAAVAELQTRLADVAGDRDSHAARCADFQAQVADLTGARDGLAMQLSELQAQVTQLLAERAEQEERVAKEAAKAREGSEKIIALTRERETLFLQAIKRESRIEELEIKSSELAKIKAELERTRDHAAQLAEQLKTELTAAAVAREAQAAESALRQARIDALSKAQEEQALHASALQAQLEQLQQEKAEAAKVATALQEKIVVLTQERDEIGAMDTIGEMASGSATAVPTSIVIDHQLHELAEQLQRQNDAVFDQLKKQQIESANSHTKLHNFIKSETANATKQLEAFLSLVHYLDSGELLGEMHGWPISPDFALLLVKQLEIGKYDLVIEFGSGTSTVLIAKALAKIAKRNPKGRPATQITFEHLEKYHGQTLAALRQAGLADAVQLVHAPLTPFIAPNGNTYSYYDCHMALAELAEIATQAPNVNILVIIDGPPGVTGKHARYPAVPAITSIFDHAHIDFLLDDYMRSDEKEVAQLWLAEMKAKEYQCMMTELQLEKDACLMTVSY